MNKFNVNVKFKNGKDLGFEIGSDEDLRANIADGWKHHSAEGAMLIGDHIINPQEILWMKIEGDIVAEPSGKEIPIREKK